jgi:ketosteroid isomerase-like protein
MSREDVDAVRAAFEQFSRGDFSAYDELPDDFELVLAPEMPDAGAYRGETARRWLDAWTESFEHLTLEPVDFRDAGDKVMAEYIQRGSPKGGATPVELRSWSVSTMRDGGVVRLQIFLSQAEALEAAGIRN